VFVLLAACGGSLRPVLTAPFGQEQTDAALERASGLAGWLNSFRALSEFLTLKAGLT
jgi:hypothetical protein